MNQLVGGHARRQAAIALHLLQKRIAAHRQRVILPAGIFPQRYIQRRFGASGANGGEIIRKKTAHRRHHYRQQRYIPHRVVNQSQQRQRGADLRRGEKAAGAGGPRGDPAAAKLVRIHRRVGGFAAQQNAKIAIPRRARFAVVGDGHGAHPFADAGSDQPRLGSVLGVQILPPRIVDHIKRGVKRGAFRIAGGGDQCVVLVVGQPPQLFAHQLGKHKVDAVGHGVAAAEIVPQRDGRRKMLAVIIGIRLLPREENIRHRLAKAVDALFDIAHHKQVLLIPRDRAEQRILRGVGVLIFVHQHLFKLLCQLLCQRGAAHGAVFLPVEQQPQRQMLQIVEIYPMLGGFFLFVCVAELPHQRAQRRHRLAQHGNILAAFGFAAAKQRGQRGQLLFYLVAQPGHPLFEQLVRILAQAAQPVEGELLQHIDGVIPVVLGIKIVSQYFQLLAIGEQRSGIGSGHLLFGCRHAPRFAQHCHAVVQRAGHIPPYRLSPCGVRNRGVGGIKCLLRLQPVVGEGVRLDKGVQPQHRFGQLAVIASTRKQLSERQKRGVAGFVGSLHHLGKRLLLHGAHVGVLRHLELGRNIQQMKIFPQQRRTKAVHRADMGAGQQHLLPLQPPVVRVRRHLFGERLAQPLLHLGSGGFGKGHHQQPVGVYRMLFIGDAPDHPLHQHSGFARSGGRRHQHGAAARINTMPLLRRPLSTHAVPPAPARRRVLSIRWRHPAGR